MGPNALLCQGNCIALIQLPVFDGPSKPYTLKTSSGSQPSPVQKHVVQTQTDRMLASRTAPSAGAKAVI